MPTYEYKCSKGHVYEKQEGFDAPARQKCVKCGSVARRQISMPAVIFKGSGFYSTDNRKGSDGDSSSESSSGDKSDKSGSDASPSDKSGSDSSASPNGASKDSGSKSKTETAKAD